jgi:hypothetical protein
LRRALAPNSDLVWANWAIFSTRLIFLYSDNYFSGLTTIRIPG